MSELDYGFSNNTLQEVEDNDDLIELAPAPQHVLRRRGKALPNDPKASKNRDRTAMMADILMAVIHYQGINTHYVIEAGTRKQIPYGSHALISQIHESCKLVASKSRNLLAELRDNDLITIKEVTKVKSVRNCKRDRVNGNTAIIIYITDKGRDYIDKMKDIHKNYYPILKDCYMIKSGLVNL